MPICSQFRLCICYLGEFVRTKLTDSNAFPRMTSLLKGHIYIYTTISSAVAYHSTPASCANVCFMLAKKLFFPLFTVKSLCFPYFTTGNPITSQYWYNTVMLCTLLCHPAPCKVNKIVAVWLAPSTLLLLCFLTENIEIFSIRLSAAKQNTISQFRVYN